MICSKHYPTREEFPIVLFVGGMNSFLPQDPTDSTRSWSVLKGSCSHRGASLSEHYSSNSEFTGFVKVENPSLSVFPVPSTAFPITQGCSSTPPLFDCRQHIESISLVDAFEDSSTEKLESMYSSYLYDAVTRTFLNMGSTVAPMESDSSTSVDTRCPSPRDVISICISDAHSAETDDISSRGLLEKIHFSLCLSLFHLRSTYSADTSCCQLLPFYSPSSLRCMSPNTSAPVLNRNTKIAPASQCSWRAKPTGTHSSRLTRSLPNAKDCKYSYYRFPAPIRSILVDWYRSHGGAKLCKEERIRLMEKTGLSAKQVSMFMINYRRRHE